MFAMETKWKVESSFSMLKVSATFQKCPFSEINERTLTDLISRMARLVERSESFTGRPLSEEPKDIVPENTLFVCTTIIFRTPEDAHKFAKEISKIIQE